METEVKEGASQEVIATNKAEILVKVTETVESMEIPSTAAPAANLRLYNFFTKNLEPSRDEIDQEVAKLGELSRKEIVYEGQEKVPTIGTELEFPVAWINDGQSNTLKALGVRNEAEPHKPDKWEINQLPSHSPSVQSRVLEELVKANIVRRGLDHALSLHINFGVPPFIRYKEQIVDSFEADTLVTMSTIAFSSKKRVETKTSIRTFLVQEEDVVANDKTGVFRFEIKTAGYEDKSAYRAMSELQMLTTAYFAYLKKTNCDQVDRELKRIWQDFIHDCKRIIEEYGGKDFAEEGVYRLVHVAKGAIGEEGNPKLVTEAQEMFKSYTQQIHKLLFVNEGEV